MFSPHYGALSAECATISQIARACYARLRSGPPLANEQAGAITTPCRRYQSLRVRKGDLQHMSPIVLAAVPSFNPIPTSGILNQIFHQTDLTIQVLDWPVQGYHINLIQLIILIVLAVVVIFVTERLTKQKPGGLLTGVILTIIGAYIVETFAKIP